MTTATPQPPRRRFWPMPMLVSWKRFGAGVIAASSLIALVGFSLYVLDTTPLDQPAGVTQQAGAFVKAAGPPHAEVPVAALQVLDRFAEALEQQDEPAIRELFPTITRREARILLAIRNRLGETADLRIHAERAVSIAPDVVHVGFVILAEQREAGRARRLPFTARLADQGGWKIVQLR